MAGYASRLGVPSLFANPPYEAALLHLLRAASLRAQVKFVCHGCGKVTRRANHQKSVQSLYEKYFAFSEIRIGRMVRPVSPGKRGVAHVTTRAVGCGGRGACERRTQALADGEVVWSWRPDAGAKFAKT